MSQDTLRYSCSNKETKGGAEDGQTIEEDEGESDDIENSSMFKATKKGKRRKNKKGTSQRPPRLREKGKKKLGNE